MEDGKVPTHRRNVLGVEVITKGGGGKSKSQVAGRTLPPPPGGGRPTWPTKPRHGLRWRRGRGRSPRRRA
jgi:hypothetical protein